MINRRLYLESPIGIQRLLIVPYKLGTIIVENNKQIQSALQRAQDNNGDVSTYQEDNSKREDNKGDISIYQKIIATKKTITKVRTITIAHEELGKYRDNKN